MYKKGKNMDTMYSVKINFFGSEPHDEVFTTNDVNIAMNIYNAMTDCNFVEYVEVLDNLKNTTICSSNESN